MKVNLEMVIVVAALAVGCQSPTGPPPASEAPTLQVTNWTDQSELFMEYPPLVAGQPALYAVHLTRLGDFSAMTEGRPRLEFTPEDDGAPIILDGDPPSRPGVFRVEGISPPAGRYQFALLVEAPDLSDRHELGTVIVFADEGSALADAKQQGGEDSAAIVYLKEQQWTNTFATAPVRDVAIRTSIRVPATVHPLPGGEAIVASPATGRFAADTLLSIGTLVQARQVLGRLEPRLPAGTDRTTLEADVAAARAEAEGARAEQERAERLLAQRAVPARRVDEARRATVVAEARLRAAEARLAQRDETLSTGAGAAAANAFVLRAPITGRLAEVMATLGASYDEGTPLFRIVRTDQVELEVQVPAVDVAVARQTDSVALELPGLPTPIELEPHHLHDSGVIEASTRALAVQMEIDNRHGELLVGQTGTAVLYRHERQRVPAVPSEAVLTEAGRPYVFVQVGGEQFERRFVEVASRDGDVVGVRSGIMPGERVVTRGAYEVQLASAVSGLPAEGHVH